MSDERDPSDILFLVERLLDRRITRYGRLKKEVVLYLVKWSTYGHEENQWVREDDLACGDLVRAYDTLYLRPNHLPLPNYLQSHEEALNVHSRCSTPTEEDGPGP